MKRVYGLVCGLLIGIAVAQSADAKSVVWGRQFGDPNAQDDGDVGVAVDAKGSVYVSGGTHGLVEGMAKNHGKKDAFIVKYDANGRQQWVTSFEGEEINAQANDSVSHMEIDSEGNLVVLGMTSGPIKGNKAAEGSEFMAKLDPNGKVIWAKHLGKLLHSHCFWTKFTLDEKDNIYLAGYNHGIGLHGNKANGFHDVFMIKLSPDASKRQWTVQYGSKKRDDYMNHTVAPDGSVYIAGSTYDVIEPGVKNQGAHDAYLAKISADGKLAFIRQFGTSENDEVSAVAVRDDGKVFVTGYGHPKGKGLFLSVFTPEGEEVSTVTYDAKLPTGVVQMKFDEKGRLWFAGKEKEDVYVFRVNSNNDKPAWMERFPVKAGSNRVALKFGPKGMLHLGGVSRSDRRSLESSDLFVMKVRPR